MEDSAATETLSTHYSDFIGSLLEGEVTPFLGAGVNRCGRPKGPQGEQLQWQATSQFLPDGSELANHLATKFNYPGAAKEDLLRVSQYIAVMQGEGVLNARLQGVLNRDFPTTPVHDFLAKLPKMLREKNVAKCYQLILTTNYDDLLERAFIAAQEPFDLVVYQAGEPDRGKFIHYPPDGEPPKVIGIPNCYVDVSPEIRTVILKIHGAVERRDPRRKGSYVITEDDYIDYLTRSNPTGLFPTELLGRLLRSHLLFLGYGLKDWNMRVILHSLAEDNGRLGYKGWAIQKDVDDLDRKFWSQRNVDIFKALLEDYIEGATQKLSAGAANG